MSKIKGNYAITHSNAFESVIQKQTTMMDIRLIAIYLAKINPLDETTKRVSFTLEEYVALMELKRNDARTLKESADRLLGGTVCVDDLDGGFTKFVLFDEFELKKIDEQWTVTIECTDKVMYLFFHLKQNFMQYDLWNILNLTERNHQRAYRILKQYEKIGHKTFTLQEFKMKLGIDGKYSEFKDFKKNVLEKCKQALAEKTDIRFDYEPIRKGRKVHAIKFTIQKNMPNTKQPLLSDFVAEMAQESMIAQDQHDDQDSLSEGFQLSASGQAHNYRDPDVTFFAEACNNEFTEAEMNRLIDALRRRVTKKGNAYDTIEFARFHILQTAYLEMCARPKVYSRVNYLLKIIEGAETATT